jgi:uncharacterized membrane protein YedE/YeeE
VTILYLALGTIFGFVLSRSGAADYDYIQGMFLFEHLQLYGIIGAAIVLTAPGLWLIKRRGRTLAGMPITIELKSMNRGTIAGGVLFGVGWSMTGMCPGPILVNIGEGKLYALAALAGALVGAWLFGTVYERLRGPFGLPAVRRPASEAA